LNSRLHRNVLLTNIAALGCVFILLVPYPGAVCRQNFKKLRLFNVFHVRALYYTKNFKHQQMHKVHLLVFKVFCKLRLVYVSRSVGVV
jgi:hypothetical protein